MLSDGIYKSAKESKKKQDSIFWTRLKAVSMKKKLKQWFGK